jgi:hypothetical protein
MAIAAATGRDWTGRFGAPDESGAIRMDHGGARVMAASLPKLYAAAGRAGGARRAPRPGKRTGAAAVEKERALWKKTAGMLRKMGES